MSCSPMGSPAAVKPQGTVMAGKPVALLGLVFLEITPEPGPRTGSGNDSPGWFF